MGKKPLIAVNFKTYTEGTGDRAVKIAEYCEEVGRDSGVNIIVIPQTADIYRVSASVKIPVFAQHIDGAGAGSFTGHVTAECVREAGASGTLINHSERRLLLSEIDSSIRAAKKSGLTAIVCTNNVSVTAAAAALGPEFVAIEPPELIGSGIPVSKADPDIVSGSVKAVKKIASGVEVLCGAGISRGEDVEAALSLGTAGVLLASGVVKAKDPKAALLNLVGKI